MKKQSSFMHRILAIILVLLIAVTGLFSLCNSNIDVEAAGDGGGGSGGGHFSGSGSGTINGVGWRFTAISDDIIASNSGTCADDLNAYLSNKINMSVVVTSYTGSVYNFVGRGDSISEQRSVRSINDIFPDIDASGFTADVRSGETLNLEQCNDFFGSDGPFDSYLVADKTNAITNFCNALGIAVPSDISAACFAIEPVLIYDNVVMSYQDCLGSQDGSSWSAGFYRSIDCSTSSPNIYIGSKTGFICQALSEIRSFTFKFTDKDGVFGNAGVTYSSSEDINSKGGFGLYGAGVQTDKPGKASSTFTLFYKGNATQPNKDFDVYNSTNIIGNESYGTIHYSVTSPETLPNNAGDLTSWSWGKSVGDSKKSTRAGNSVTHRITGLSSSNWDKYSGYYNVTAGVQRITFSSASGRRTSNIVSTVNKTVDDIKKIKLTTKPTSVTGGNINVGNYYTLTLGGSNNADSLVSNIANKLANRTYVFNNNSASKIVGAGRYSGNMSAIATNFGLKALDCSKKLKSISTDKYSTSDSSFGVSVTVMAKKKKVTSYVAYATLDRETGAITYNSNDAKSYDVSQTGTFKVPASMSKLCLYIVVPNNSGYSLEGNRNGSAIFSKASVDISSNSGLKDAANAAGITNISSYGFIQKGQTVKVGCVNDTTGYSVLVLQLTGNVTHKSTLELYDYELNYMYPSMITNGVYASLLDLGTYKKTGSNNIGSGCNVVSSDTYTGPDARKTISASSSYAGNIINRNKNLGSNKNILRYDSYTRGKFTTESNARNGYTFSSNLTNVKFSLAVNLVRGDFDSKVTVSSISSQTLGQSYAKSNLGLQWSNTPAGSNNANAKRNSSATIGGDKSDTFEWTVKYTLTDSVYANSLVSNVKNDCKNGHITGSGDDISISYCAPVTYYRIVSTDTPGSFDGTRVKYVVTEKAYKYQSDTIATTENTTKTVATSLQSSTSGINNSSSAILNPYKIAVVNSSNKTLGFYPEVKMRAYSSTGDTITNSLSSSGTTNRQANGAVVPHTVKVLGEIKRTLKPSSMYTIKVTSPNNNVVTGTTISDSIAVGSNANNVSGGLPVIYAGGDVSLNVTPNFKLNMYAYSLDLIETTDTILSGTGNYSTVVADNSAVKSIWGNDSSYKPLDDFNSWISDTLGKIAVDTTLTVNGDGVNKTYNNFASSVGNLGNNDASADGVYNIRIEKGTIVNDGGYQALIAQIKSDYSCTEAQAKTIFEKSDIYQSIANAVEDCNDSFNTSRKANAIDSSRSHWYDEEVKTFVIRRYKKEDIQIKNILVNDKIDYGAAPTASTTTSSTTSLKKATAKWYLTLYFKDLPTCFTSGTTLYNPTSYAGLSSANTAGTVLINECYISGADFVIPSSSTHNMNN